MLCPVILISRRDRALSWCISLLTSHGTAICIKISHPRKLRVRSLHDVLQLQLLFHKTEIQTPFLRHISRHLRLSRLQPVSRVTPSLTRITIQLQTFITSQSLQNLHPSMVIQNTRLLDQGKNLKGRWDGMWLHNICRADHIDRSQAEPMSPLTPCASTSGRYHRLHVSRTSYDLSPRTSDAGLACNTTYYILTQATHPLHRTSFASERSTAGCHTVCILGALFGALLRRTVPILMAPYFMILDMF